ncbi:hypothetical protein QBC43DRAFT_234683, partial [Cladorrhinum sp. PSN259]
MMPGIRIVKSLRPSTIRSTSLLPCRAARSLSTTLPRPASPSPADPRGGDPVDDIDVVFDYPSEAQGSISNSPPSLESSGLGAGLYPGGKYTGKGIDDTIGSMRHTMGSMKEGMKDTMDEMKDGMGEMKDNMMGEAMGSMGGVGRMVGSQFKEPMKRIDKEMGYPDNNVIYAGLGALGLGALYMTLREPPPTEEIRRRDPTVDARRTMRNAKHDYPAHAPLENKVEKMIGRSG